MKMENVRIFVANLHNKNECYTHIKIFKKVLSFTSFIVYRVIKFNQKTSKWTNC